MFDIINAHLSHHLALFWPLPLFFIYKTISKMNYRIRFMSIQVKRIHLHLCNANHVQNRVQIQLKSPM